MRGATRLQPRLLNRSDKRSSPVGVGPLSPSPHGRVVASLCSVERALDCINHREIQLEAWRSVAARIDVDTGGADVETRICQPSAHELQEPIDLVYPHRALVEHRALHLSAVEHRHSLRAPNRIELDHHLTLFPPVSGTHSFYLLALARDLFKPLSANSLSKPLIMATTTKLHVFAL